MSNYPPPGGYPPAGGSYPPPGQQPPGGWAPPGQGPGVPGPGGPGSGQWPPSGPPPQQQGPWGAPPPGGYGYAPGGYNQGPRSWPKAGWWARLAAVIIDGIIIGLLSIPAYIVLLAGPTEIETCSVDSEGTIRFGEPDNALCEVPTGGTIAIAVILGLAAFAGALAYWAILEGKRGQTLGKQALGIRTVDANSGQPIGPGRAIGRYFARILSAIPCSLGYLWPLWDEQKQSFHDKIVNSVVVRT